MSHAFPGCPAPTASTLLLLALAAAAALNAPGADPTGDWFTEDKGGVITIAPCGDAPTDDRLCGAITGLSKFDAKGQGPRDVHGTPECQLRFIRDMKPGDDNRRHGTVTDPTDGKVYQAELWVSDDGVLNLRGYIGLPLLGSTQHWTRFSGKRSADCHFRK